MKKKKHLWIAWERQRRTIELSKALNVQLHILEPQKDGLIRYVYLITKTFKILIKINPSLFFVQNPSIVLTFLAIFLKPVFRYKLIVDRHTNFREIVLLNLGIKTKFKDRVHMLLSRVTLKFANLTIITNSYLKHYVKLRGGRAFVLPDKIPEIRRSSKSKNRSKQISYICSHSLDEPHEEVIKAASLIDPEIKIFITGNYKKTNKNLKKNTPSNVIFTGFMSDQDYWNLLNKSDIIMVFTKLDHCLVCGAYEAVAVEKPVILSNKKVLIEYFNKGAIHVEHSPRDIAEAIRAIYNDYDKYISDITSLNYEIRTNWGFRFEKLKNKILNYY